jgi:hypothetical protein
VAAAGCVRVSVSGGRGVPAGRGRGLGERCSPPLMIVMPFALCAVLGETRAAGISLPSSGRRRWC